jgi:hypothetical protein
MKTNKSLILKSTFAVALIAMATLWALNRASASVLTGREILFPSVGIARGQTARINFTNVSDGELNFTLIAVDDNNVSHLRTVMTLQPGQTGHADLNADLIGLLEGRQQIRAAVDAFVGDPTVEHGGGGGGGTGRFAIASLEVVDNDTGKTQVFVIPTNQ